MCNVCVSCMKKYIFHGEMCVFVCMCVWCAMFFVYMSICTWCVFCGEQVHVMWCVIHMYGWCGMSSMCEHVYMMWYVLCITHVPGLFTCISWHVCVRSSLCPMIVCIPSLLYSLIFRKTSFHMYNVAASHFLCLWRATLSADSSDQNPDMSAELLSVKFPLNGVGEWWYNSIWLPELVSWLAPNPSPNLCF